MIIALDMEKTCRRCNWDIIELQLPEEQLVVLWGMLNHGMRLFAMQYLRQHLTKNLVDVKAIVQHWHEKAGHCVRCNYTDLVGDHVACPKCKAFNYNLQPIIPFDADFCAQLAFRLHFGDWSDPAVNSFWCDGIDHWPQDYTTLVFSKLRQQKHLTTTAWLGPSGQDRYEMTVYFGPRALALYGQKLRLEDSIPDVANPSWIELLTEEKRISITLL
ncbi:MAG: hypothetical protein AAFN81_03270 [Bacteroidota bacterium]